MEGPKNQTQLCVEALEDVARLTRVLEHLRKSDLNVQQRELLQKAHDSILLARGDLDAILWIGL